MNLQAIASTLAGHLPAFGISLVDSGSSVYIKLQGAKNCKQIRVSDHNGRSTTGKCWELRMDVMTQRKSKIFNIRDLKVLISLIK